MMANPSMMPDMEEDQIFEETSHIYNPHKPIKKSKKQENSNKNYRKNNFSSA